MTAQTIIKHSLRIAWKDLMELFRNRMGLVLLIVMPLFMMVMVGFIYPSGGASLNNMPIAMVNEDAGFNGSYLPSQTFFTTLQSINDQTGMMTLTTASSLEEVTDLVQRGELSGGIVIPSNFSQSILSGEQGTIIIVTDQSNPQISATINAVLSGVFDGMSTAMAQQNVLLMNPTLNQTTALAVVKPLTVQSQGVVPGNPSYFDFIAPGLMAMTVMMSVMTGLPVAISHEKELGTMDGMMVAPVNRLSILLGKTLAQTLRGLIQGAIILALAIGIFGVAIQGNILLVFALLLLGVFSFVGLGIVITSFTKDQETAQMLMMTLMFPMMFLSGVFFPIQQMPGFMQAISHFLPLTYAADALRKVMVLGAGVSQISTELLILTGFGVVMIAIALPVFRKMMTR
ncbi:ABC transporter permease [Candidatus Bathycorpusculum sp.]|uniref:ABC transporter permease n=1 Tax=Candidatus Bathycorpusculum sp. TaxID=2994959 RepID=UPI0028227530|nr:ABC transporter permease [Candidatus Termitimicrobium sp.]MCL2686692.1 ABC transporter permease [Candidatus Termitimicrobium sp.]